MKQFLALDVFFFFFFFILLLISASRSAIDYAGLANLSAQPTESRRGGLQRSVVLAPAATLKLARRNGPP